MREGLTKKESAFLKGLALWMMIYHHRFINDAVWHFDVDYIGHFDFLLGEEFTRIVAWFCKIALSLMTFVSGYGICFVFKKSRKDVPTHLLKDDYKSVLKRFIPFYGRYWYAFIIWTFCDIAFLGIPLKNPEYLLNALGLSYSLNGSWWYVLQYVEMMLLAPFLDLYFTKLGKKWDIIKWVTPVILGGIIVAIPGGTAFSLKLLDVSCFQLSYMAIFVVGYIVARWNIYGVIRTWLGKRHFIIRYGICLIGMIGIMAVRIKLSTFAAYCRTDFIIAPIWILCFCELLTLLPFIVDFFGWFSKYSMYIWVLHLVFFDKFFYWITLKTNLALGNYLTLVLMITVASVILEQIEINALNLIKKLKHK